MLGVKGTGGENNQLEKCIVGAPECQSAVFIVTRGFLIFSSRPA